MSIAKVKARLVEFLRIVALLRDFRLLRELVGGYWVCFEDKDREKMGYYKL